MAAMKIRIKIMQSGETLFVGDLDPVGYGKNQHTGETLRERDALNTAFTIERAINNGVVDGEPLRCHIEAIYPD